MITEATPVIMTATADWVYTYSNTEFEYFQVNNAGIQMLIRALDSLDKGSAVALGTSSAIMQDPVGLNNLGSYDLHWCTSLKEPIFQAGR